MLPAGFLDNNIKETPTIPVHQASLLMDNEYYAMLQSLNNKQQQLFQYILDWCQQKRLNNTTPPFHIFCSGGAGVGKSHLTKSVVHMVNRELRKPGDNPDDIIIQLSAPTGTAAYQLDVNTLHSIFSLNVNKGNRTNSLSAEKLATLRSKFATLKVLKIDEISMVGANLLVHVHERLAAIAGLPNSTPFAGLSILAVGDFQQLPPVCEPPVYKPPGDGYYALASLWMSNFKVFELTEAMHKKGDKEFADLLNRIRVDQYADEDVQLLQTRLVSEEDPSIDNCMRLFSLNADVDAFNSQRLVRPPTHSIEFKAVDKLPAECSSCAVTVTNENSGLPALLCLKIGAHVMLVRNVDTELGLFNGAIGTVTGFMPPHSSPSYILVLFDNIHLQETAQQKYPHFSSAYSIERFEARFPLKARTNKFVEATRLQFPLKVAFAITIHKCQGQTIQSLVVSLKGYFRPGQAYVALSRCTSLAGLFITDFNCSCIKVNKQGLAALQLMQSDNCLLDPHQARLESHNVSVIKVAVLNTRSLYKHADNILKHCYMSAADLLVFTDSRLQSDCVPLQFHGCMMYSANTPAEHNYAGGVAVVAKRYLPAFELLDYKTELMQMVALRIDMTSQRPFIIIAVYRSPALPVSALKTSLQEHLQTLNDHQLPILIVSDFMLMLAT